MADESDGSSEMGSPQRHQLIRTGSFPGSAAAAVEFREFHEPRACDCLGGCRVTEISPRSHPVTFGLKVFGTTFARFDSLILFSALPFEGTKTTSRNAASITASRNKYFVVRTPPVFNNVQDFQGPYKIELHCRTFSMEDSCWFIFSGLVSRRALVRCGKGSQCKCG